MIRLLIAALLLLGSIATGVAAPARIIILRHGEKANPWKLCEVGVERADALAATYLGAKASKSLFADGDEPAFFFAITLHTLELAAPSVATWSKPIILYSVVPDEADDDDLHVKALNRRTQEAAANIMQNPALNGKTVVMVWEHKHIANEKLEAKFEGEAVTSAQAAQTRYPAGRAENLAERQLRLFLDRRFPAELQRAVEIHHGEAGLRTVLRERAVERLGHAGRARCIERLQGEVVGRLTKQIRRHQSPTRPPPAHPRAGPSRQGDGAPAPQA